MQLNASCSLPCDLCRRLLFSGVMGATRATALLHAGLRRDWVVLHPCYRCYTWQPKGKRHPIAPPPKIIPPRAWCIGVVLP